ncbi:hypothetical protein [Xanthocytophaga agilis]|uniref:DUF4377 domain-containing protein n=1 Tax=Xanthocytophaga agilis TaxID=3048010 RepID=A0AAE3RBL7_9BACT|nr:hypothetical protein [Xanthocytophaga agilis]MDJ1505240.1 hypothetical protein [Xanthocytophaga agilis]
MSYLSKLANTLLLSLVLMACTKTEVIGPPTLSSSRILSYKVTNVSGDPIEGVINEADQTITVYLPYYYYSTSLLPEIEVSEGATVTPASETLLSGLLSYIQGDSILNYTYTVRGKEGSSATYKLMLQVQQPDFTLQELSSDAQNPTTYTVTTYDGAAINLNWSGDFPSISDETGRIITKITLIAENGQKYIIDNNIGFKSWFSDTGILFYIPVNSATQLPTGLYHVQVTFYSKTVTLQNPIQLIQP